MNCPEIHKIIHSQSYIKYIHIYIYKCTWCPEKVPTSAPDWILKADIKNWLCCL